MSRRFTTLLSLVLLPVLLAPVPPVDQHRSSTLLVANKSGNSLYFVHPNSLTVTDSVDTGDQPHEVAAAPDHGQAYVTNYGDGTITVVNVETRTASDHWSLEGYDRPHGIAVGPEEKRVYVTAENNQAVLELDAKTGRVRREFHTGKETTHMLALSSDAHRLYATSIGSGTLSTVNLASGEVMSHIPTGDGAEGVAVAPGDDRVWVTNRAEDSVSIVDPNTSQIVETLEVTGFPIRVDISNCGNHAIISSARAGTVSVFDTNNYEVRSQLQPGDLPIGVLISPSGKRAFVANAGSNSVSTINLETLSIEKTGSMGREPDGMAFVSDS